MCVELKKAPIYLYTHMLHTMNRRRINFDVTLWLFFVDETALFSELQGRASSGKDVGRVAWIFQGYWTRHLGRASGGYSVSFRGGDEGF